MGIPRTQHVRVIDAAAQWAEDKAIADEAQDALARSREKLLKRLTLPDGTLAVGAIVLPDLDVIVGLRQDRCFDTELLKAELSTRRFNEITVPRVDPARWDLFSAKLDPELVEAAVTLKPVTVIKAVK